MAGILDHVTIILSQCDENDLLTSTTDLDHMIQPKAVTETSQTCQLTQDQSVILCKQLQQVSDYQIMLLLVISNLLALSTSLANFLVIPL